MTNTVTLNSTWGTDAAGANCPQVVLDYPPVFHAAVETQTGTDDQGNPIYTVTAPACWTGISSFSQIGSQVPNDTWFGQIWCDDTTLTALQADSKYNGNLTVVFNDQDPPQD